MISSSLDALERAFYDIHGEGHALDAVDIRRALFETLCITADTPIGVAIERLDSARAGCIKTAEMSLGDFQMLCSSFAGTADYTRPFNRAYRALHARALLRALRDELTLLELFAAESELSAAVDVS
ncbi:hypothetical protein SAMN05446935_0320 [Burkholderia sp. YR290]|nr:hypothetical protein SAMN05446935_0320 [Burkholderia sp. YR290]